MFYGMNVLHNAFELYLSECGDTGDGWLNYNRTSEKAFIMDVLRDMLTYFENSGYPDDNIPAAPHYPDVRGKEPAGE